MFQDCFFDRLLLEDYRSAERLWRRAEQWSGNLPSEDDRRAIDGLTVEQTIAYAEALLAKERE